MPDDSTTIQVSKELWRELNQRKKGPGDTFEDVIWKLVEGENNETGN